MVCAIFSSKQLSLSLYPQGRASESILYVDKSLDNQSASDADHMTSFNGPINLIDDTP